jgi:c-di-GMP-binding flagellar brake protein YcgR
MGKQDRKYERIDFYLPVTIKGHQGLTKVKDLSLGGLFIFIEMQDTSRFKQGDEIELIMELPHEKNPIEPKALVARVTDKGIGVEFVDLSPRDTMALEYCFNIFKHTVPIANS